MKRKWRQMCFYWEGNEEEWGGILVTLHTILEFRILKRNLRGYFVQTYNIWGVDLEIWWFRRLIEYRKNFGGGYGNNPKFYYLLTNKHQPFTWQFLAISWLSSSFGLLISTFFVILRLSFLLRCLKSQPFGLYWDSLKG